MKDNEDEPEDVREATPVAGEIESGAKDETAGNPRTSNKRNKKNVEKPSRCDKNAKKPTPAKSEANCCASRSSKPSKTPNTMSVLVYSPPCVLPRLEIVPRHCLSKQEYVDILATPSRKCPSECSGRTVVRKIRPISSRINELAQPARRLILGTLQERGETLPPEMISNLVKSIEGTACLTPEQAENYFRDKERKKGDRRAGKTARLKCKGKSKKDECPSQLDKEAVMCQYLMAERFVKSILGWKCPIPVEEFEDIAGVILRRLSFVLEYAPVDGQDLKTQQMRFLADIIGCWISGVLFEVAEERKKELEEELTREEEAEVEEEEEEDEDEVEGLKEPENEPEEDDEEEGAGEQVIEHVKKEPEDLPVKELEELPVVVKSEPEDPAYEQYEQTPVKEEKKEEEEEEEKRREAEAEAERLRTEAEEKKRREEREELERKEAEEKKARMEEEAENEARLKAQQEEDEKKRKAKEEEEAEEEERRRKEAEEQKKREEEKEEEERKEKERQRQEEEEEEEKKKKKLEEEEEENRIRKEAEEEAKRREEKEQEEERIRKKEAEEQKLKKEKEAEELEKKKKKKEKEEDDALKETGPSKAIEEIGEGKLFKSEIPFVTFGKILDTVYNMLEDEPEVDEPDLTHNRIHRAVYEKLANIIELEDPSALTENLKDVVDVVSGKTAAWIKRLLNDSELKSLAVNPPEVESSEIRNWGKWIDQVTDKAGDWADWIHRVVQEAEAKSAGNVNRGDWQNWTSDTETNALLWRRYYLETIHQAHHNRMMVVDRPVVKTGQKTSFQTIEEETKNTDLGI